ncbi:hypothetical protein [Actinokineospora sp.]|uniref:hypothetical protein n=1 Tax=Actinokineospora sp. TaxID=1872133 RepID=UPI003D6ACEC1
MHEFAGEIVVKDEVPANVDTESAHDGDVPVTFDPAEGEAVSERARTGLIAAIRIG